MPGGFAHRALALSKQGPRDYNEDRLFPADPAHRTTLYMVCDGVGRSNRGDRAATEVCARFPGHYRNSASAYGPRLEHALKRTEADLRQMIADDPTLSGMATTLTFVDLDHESPIVAWIGDSRVYHIRNGSVRFATRDHSVVAELIERGEITESEAAVHPRKNVITRAVAGEPATEIAYALIPDVRIGDYLLLCSDGVSTCLDAPFIERTFRAGSEIEWIANTVDKRCGEVSRDNYSFWLIEITASPGRAQARIGTGWFIGTIAALTLSALALFLVPRLNGDQPEAPSDEADVGADTTRPSIFAPVRQPDMEVDSAR